MILHAYILCGYTTRDLEKELESSFFFFNSINSNKKNQNTNLISNDVIILSILQLKLLIIISTKLFFFFFKFLLRTFCPQFFYPLRYGSRIEALSLYGSRYALSEDSGFNSYPSRPEVYLVKKRRETMEVSNCWGYGYKTQHSYPRSRLIT